METTAQLLSMKGRRVLITGAASGIGRAMAFRFADAGADLLLLDIEETGLARTNQCPNRFSSSVATFVVDLQQKAEIDAFWERMGGELPDTLINNAGSYPLRDYLEVDPDYLEKTLQVNFASVVWMCQSFIACRKEKGGVIVNMSSVEAMAPFRDDLIPYSASKAGVIALTRGLAHAYGRQGFRVNMPVPGAIKTPGTERLAKAAVRRLNVDLLKAGYHFGNRLALGRWGEADEVARVALFLASDLASYVQGAALPVDGGFLAS
jgi:NAD(P)-dependent dehydrogenase (short-subunit alcohol dehydrogenase family)